MPTLVVPVNVSPCQIDIPERMPVKVEKGKKAPKQKREQRKVERSSDGKGRPRKGSIHVRPASTLSVSDDEWACMKHAHPDLTKKMIEVKEAPKKPVAAKKTAAKKAPAKPAKPAKPS